MHKKRHHKLLKLIFNLKIKFEMAIFCVDYGIISGRKKKNWKVKKVKIYLNFSLEITDMSSLGILKIKCAEMITKGHLNP